MVYRCSRGRTEGAAKAAKEGVAIEATIAEMAADPIEAGVTAEEKIIAEASEAAEAATEEITAEAT